MTAFEQFRRQHPHHRRRFATSATFSHHGHDLEAMLDPFENFAFEVGDQTHYCAENAPALGGSKASLRLFYSLELLARDERRILTFVRCGSLG